MFFHNILAPLYLVLPRFGPFRVVLFGFVAFLNLFQRVSLRLCVFLAFLYGFVPILRRFNAFRCVFVFCTGFCVLVSHRLQFLTRFIIFVRFLWFSTVFERSSSRLEGQSSWLLVLEF